MPTTSDPGPGVPVGEVVAGVAMLAALVAVRLVRADEPGAMFATFGLGALFGAGLCDFVASRRDRLRATR